jgi:hypothetical protein
MRIEVLEDRLSDVDADTGRHYGLSKGDIVTVADKYGARLCSFGWVKDVDGKVETGERKPGAEALVVNKAAVGSRGRVRG